MVKRENDAYTTFYTRTPDGATDITKVGAARRELERMRAVMRDDLPPARRAVLFAEAGIEDPLLPEPPRPDWADKQKSESE